MKNSIVDYRKPIISSYGSKSTMELKKPSSSKDKSQSVVYAYESVVVMSPLTVIYPPLMHTHLQTSLITY